MTRGAPPAPGGEGPPRRKRYMTVNEVADAAGVIPRTIYNRIKAGEMPYVRFGRLLRVPVVAVDELLRTGTVSAEFRERLAAAFEGERRQAEAEMRRMTGNASYVFRSRYEPFIAPPADISGSQSSRGAAPPLPEPPHLPEPTPTDMLPRAPTEQLLTENGARDVRETYVLHVTPPHRTGAGALLYVIAAGSRAEAVAAARKDLPPDFDVL